MQPAKQLSAKFAVALSNDNENDTTDKDHNDGGNWMTSLGKAAYENLHIDDMTKQANYLVHQVDEMVDDVVDNVQNIGEDMEDKTTDIANNFQKQIRRSSLGQGVMNAANFVMQNSPEKDEEETTESLFDRRIRLEKEEEGRPPRARRRSSSMQKAQDRRQMMFEDADMESVLREAKEDMFLKGEAPLIATTTTQLGTMGVGIQLYFQVTKFLAIAFFAMACCHIPSMYFHSAGNDGHALHPDFQSSLSSLSFANQGFDAKTITDPSECYQYDDNATLAIDFNDLPLNEDGEQVVDCKGKWVNIYGTFWKSSTITGIITTCEFISSSVFIVTCAICIFIVARMEAKCDDENAEPEDFAVFVRNLPRDVTIEEVINHFSPRYDLQKEETEYYPTKLTPFGYSVRRINKYFWWWLIFVSPFVGWLVAEFSDAETGANASLWSGFILVLDFAWTNYRKIGENPEMRKAPWKEYDDARVKNEIKKAKREEKKKKKGGKKSSSSGAIAPKEDEKDEEEEPPYDKTNDPFRPNQQPVLNTSNTGNSVYKGTWIAEVSLIHPTLTVIEPFKASEKQMKRMKIREAKLKKRQDSAKNKKLLDKAKTRTEQKKERLMKAVDVSKTSEVNGAYIIFNCEESKDRCVEDYDCTENWFYRRFQPDYLKFKHRDGKSYNLRITKAPSPQLVHVSACNKMTCNLNSTHLTQPNLT